VRFSVEGGGKEKGEGHGVYMCSCPYILPICRSIDRDWVGSGFFNAFGEMH
jgi:hypothetical protein